MPFLPSVTSKRTVRLLPPRHTAVLDQSAEPDARPRRHMLFHDIAGRIEKNDRIAKRIEHQRNGDAQHGYPAADQNETSLLASHATGLVWTRQFFKKIYERFIVLAGGEVETDFTSTIAAKI